MCWFSLKKRSCENTQSESQKGWLCHHLWTKIQSERFQTEDGVRSVYSTFRGLSLMSAGKQK